MSVAFASPLMVCRNRAESGAGFTLPADGWIMLVPKGDFPGVLMTYQDGARIHEDVVQRFDDSGLASMAEDWETRAKSPNFPGMLVDFDHFSHNTDKPSEAAGWVEDVELREDGLWGRVRWTALGREKVEGGVYRLVSPVLSEIETIDGEGDPEKPVVRPRRIDRLALTNDPKLRGMPPVTNRCGDRRKIQPNRSAMNPRDILCKLLGLAPECTDDELSAAADKALAGKGEPAAETEAMRNRLRVATTENATLRNRLAELEKDAIEADVREFLPRFGGTEDELRALLTENRGAVRKTLLAMKDAKPAAGSGSDSMREGRNTPRFRAQNRDRGSADRGDGVEGDDNASPDVPAAAQIRLRAETLASQNGWSFNRAFAEANDEWRRKRRAELAKS